MMITLHLTPVLEAHLRERAARCGKPVEDYILFLAEQDTAGLNRNAPEPVLDDAPERSLADRIDSAQPESVPGPSSEDRDNAFREFCRGINIGAALTDGDLRRENFYEDRF